MQPVLNPKAKKGQPMYSFVPVTYQGGIDPNAGYAKGGKTTAPKGIPDKDLARLFYEDGNNTAVISEVNRRIEQKLLRKYNGDAGAAREEFRTTNDPMSILLENYAHGGEVELSDGAFVLDARTVSEIGNGSSNAGIEILRHLGGHPVKGPGDGVSDSVPARIGRHQPARVARDEVIMPADVVRRIGKGNPKRGADKLYALMDKAHKARKKAERGQDTKLIRGLA
jgi:hypothetical protein